MSKGRTKHGRRQALGDKKPGDAGRGHGKPKRKKKR